MATFRPSSIMTSQLSLYALLSWVVLTAGTAAPAAALTGATSSHTVRVSAPVQSPALQHARDAAYHCLCSFWTLISRRYERASRGQLGLSDMVQLIALCSIIQGLRVWRRRPASQEEDTSDAGRKVSGSKRGSPWNSRESSTSGKSTRAPRMMPYDGSLTLLLRRSTCHRSWPIEEVFQLQVLHYVLYDLPFDKKILQAASPS